MQGADKAACRDCKERQRCEPRTAEASPGCNQHHNSSPSSAVHRYTPRPSLDCSPHVNSTTRAAERKKMRGQDAVLTSASWCAADCEPAEFSLTVAATDEGGLGAAAAKPPAKTLQAEAPSPKALTGSKQLLKAALARPQAQAHRVAPPQTASQQGRAWLKTP